MGSAEAGRGMTDPTPPADLPGYTPAPPAGAPGYTPAPSSLPLPPQVPGGYTPAPGIVQTPPRPNPAPSGGGLSLPLLIAGLALIAAAIGGLILDRNSWGGFGAASPSAFVGVAIAHACFLVAGYPDRGSAIAGLGRALVALCGVTAALGVIGIVQGGGSIVVALSVIATFLVAGLGIAFGVITARTPFVPRGLRAVPLVLHCLLLLLAASAFLLALALLVIGVIFAVRARGAAAQLEYASR